MSTAAAEAIADQFLSLREEMNKYVVGHETVKTGIILGMMSREHIYIEGPPGMAKTMLAEIVSAASNLEFYLYQFHRDTRLAELVGDVVIQREPVALEEFKKGKSDNKHILFLTDGEPTQGDWLVREERRQAKGMGVSVHTLFIGTTECPEILDILSEETDGSKFLATPNDKGGLVIEERADRTTLDRYLKRPDRAEPLRDDASSASRPA